MKNLYLLLSMLLTPFVVSKTIAQCSVSITSSGPTAFCQGSLGATLTAHYIGGNATSYTWMYQPIPGSSYFAVYNSSTDSNYAPTATGTYWAAVTNGSCIAAPSNTIYITVNPIPAGTITTSTGTLTPCAGDPLCTNPSLPGWTYLWTFNGIADPNATGAGCDRVSGMGTYQVYVTNAYGCMGTFAPFTPTSVLTPPDTPIATCNGPVCSGDTAHLYATCTTSGVGYNWAGPNGFTSIIQNPSMPNADTTMAGSYVVKAIGSNGCATQSLSTTLVLSCQDSVWPGDANYDYIVNNSDIFALAAAINTTGPVRNNASISWTAQYAVNWPAYIYSNVNRKHADCNGDGIVDVNDVNAITQNYSLTHPKFNWEQQAKVTGYPDLYFDLAGINFAPGATVHIPLKFGNTVIPAPNTWGIAGTLKISGINLANAPVIDFSNGWLGSNTLPFAKATDTNTIDWAIARTDHHNISGGGTIGIVSFTIPASAGNGQQIMLQLNGIQVVDSIGTELTAFNILNDTGTIAPAGITNIITPSFSVSPNPARTEISIEYSKAGEIVLNDITGKTMQIIELLEGATRKIVKVSELSAGVYFYRYLVNGNAVHTGKIILIR